MRVAIIDDGINDDSFVGVKACESIVITNDATITKTDGKRAGIQSHGTICAAIIKKYEPDIQFVSISILDNHDYRGNCKQLIEALKYCEENKLKVIHMSLGSEYCKDTPLVQKIVLRLIAKNYILVAAQSNRGRYTVPANIPGVFSVKGSDRIYGDQIQLNRDRYKDAILSASNFHVLKTLSGEDYIPIRANSFAAPVVTAKLISYLKKGNQYLTITNWRYDFYRSIGIKPVHEYDTPDFFNEAILIRFNTGIKLQYGDLRFRCRAIYDVENIKSLKLIKNSFIALFFCKSHEIEKNIKLFIARNCNKILGVLFLGSISKDMRSFIKKYHIQYWDEEKNDKIQSTIIENTSLTVPVIEFVGKMERTVWFVNKISNRLLMNGFFNKVVSNFPFSYCYGYEYYNNQDVLPSILVRLERVYDLSCILICSERQNSKITSRCQVFIQEDGSYVYQDSVSQTALSGNCNNINEIYEKIMLL